MARTVDAIWHAAGDRSADWSWYSKRAILAGVYGATLLFWLRDDSDGGCGHAGVPGPPAGRRGPDRPAAPQGCRAAEALSLGPEDAALLRLAGALRDDGYQFVTPTPATHARVNGRAANAWADGLAGVFGWSRPFRGGVLPAATVAMMRDAGVLQGDAESARSLVRLSSLGGMHFLHSAYPTETADAVFFGPDTYRFAAAIATWLDYGHPVRRAVDVGCGAGPGAMVIARSRPGADVFAVDINEAALRLTRVNAALNGADRVRAAHSDMLSGVDGAFDLIVSNPPYLADPAERAYRHGGGPLGAALSLAILDSALDRLAQGGTLLLYTGAAIVDGHDAFRAAAVARCQAAGHAWQYREVDPDVFGEELEQGAYVGTDRLAAVVLTTTRGG